MPLIGLVIFACARRPPEHNPVDSGSGGSGGNGGTSSAPKDAQVPRDRDLSDVSFVYDGPMDDGSVDRDAACAAEAIDALPLAIDMYLMLDRSATMSEPLQYVPDCKVGDNIDSRWCYAINALGQFFAAPTSNGLGIALGFVPHGNCSQISATEQNCCALNENQCCEGGEDAVPEVAMGNLPGHRNTLVAALDAQDPKGTTTPLEAALRGLVRYTAENRRVDRQMVGVIVTDGSPVGCDPDVTNLAKILSDHRAATGQLTFVIGITGADYNVLEQLAVAGGAKPHTNYCAGGIQPCSFYDVGNGNPEAFVDALQQIQRIMTGCRFGMPTTDAGLVDPKTLVVEWTSPNDPVPTRIPYVGKSSDCGEGWYEDPDNPSQFALCPDTCNFVQGKPRVNIDVLVGCLGS